MKKFICSFILIFTLIITGCKNEDYPITLSNKNYKESKFVDIDSKKLNKLVKEEESFVLFIYQPLCVTSYEFNKVLTEFLNEYKLAIYKIPFSEIKGTSLEDKVKYYPSFVVYNKGEVVDYLDAESDEDTEYYKTVNAFKDWLDDYITFDVNESNNYVSNTKKENKKNDTILEDVEYSKDKINIYFFWGKGCPHCEEEFEFFESIQNEFGDYINIHSFEVWYNKDNEELLEEFSSRMGDTVRGVPYTIIGKKTFTGFSSDYEEDMLKAIKEQYKNSYDVYFDKDK